jgi:hypothetical protein
MCFIARQCSPTRYIKTNENDPMQVLLQGKQVQEETTKETLLEILADKYSRTILESTIEMPKSALDLSNDCGIPISTAYRRVQRLHSNKLLGISGSINEDGKKYFLYKSKIKSIMTCFKNGAIEVEIVPNSSDLQTN